MQDVISKDTTVEVNLKDLLSQMNSASQERPTEAKKSVSKEDFLKLSRLKIEAAFKPKIKAAKLRNQEAGEAYTEFVVIVPQENMDAIGQSIIDKVNKLHEKANVIAKELQKLTGKAVTELPELVFKSTGSTSIGEAELEFVVYCKDGTSLNSSVETPANTKKALQTKADLLLKKDVASTDYTILCKSQETALKEVVDEVEAGLIQYQIDQSKEDQALADAINGRVDKFRKDNLLVESTE